MCFYHYDYAWYASICEQDTIKAEIPHSCTECNAKIVPGDECWYIYMQEHEECHRCNEGECECPEDKCCECEEPDFGESSEDYLCMGCHKFLEAIKEVETEAGCKGDSTQPGLGGMIEALQNEDDVERYFERAQTKYPELVESGYLDRLHLWICGEDED